MQLQARLIKSKYEQLYMKKKLLEFWWWEKENEFDEIGINDTELFEKH